MKEKNIKVSVIIPVYNSERFISETIQSVLDQTFQDFEIILVDDKSTDTSRSIINEFKLKDNRIKLIESNENFGGPARPRNKGIKEAKGEYLAFLDSDDLWHREKLEKQLAFMESKKVNFSSTFSFVIDERSDLIKSKFRKPNRHGLKILIMKNFIFNSSVIVENNELIKFCEDKDLIAVEDYFLWLQLFIKKNMTYAYFNEKLLFYRNVDASISQRDNRNLGEIRALHCVLKFFMLSKRFDLLIIFYKRAASKYIKRSTRRIISYFLLRKSI